MDMEECIISLSGIEKEVRNHFVFYATNELIIYKDRQYILAHTCDGTEICRIRYSGDYKHYESIEFHDAVILIFSGKHLVFIDKYGSNSFNFDIPIEKFGRSLSKIIKAPNDNSIIFGAKLYGRIHFVNFDFMTHKRIWQTSSWEVEYVNNVVDGGHTIYSLMDNTFIVSFDKNGKTKWTRFESGQSQPSLIPFSDRLLYASEGGLRITDGKNVENIRIPMVRPTSLETLIGDKLYFTTRDKRNIGCYNIKKKEMIWEITGSFPIIKTLTIKGQKKDGRIVDVMLVQTNKDIAVLNLTDGKAHTFFRADTFIDMHRVRNHIIFHQAKGTTIMIPGITQEDH